MKTQVSIQTKLRLVNELTILNEKLKGLLSFSEVKSISNEMTKKLEYFTEQEKIIFIIDKF